MSESYNKGILLKSAGPLAFPYLRVVERDKKGLQPVFYPLVLPLTNARCMRHQTIKLKRTATLVRILTKYGFGALLINSSLRSKVADTDTGSDMEEVIATGIYERIRMAIEELGPTYIKFAQAFSDREDLLPAPMIAELRKLQDRVEADRLDIRQIVADELDIDPGTCFSDITETPLASASIAQVYRAVLKDGSPVILKVKRPGIREVISADLLIMKDVVRLLVAYSDRFRKMNLVEVLDAFEKSIYRELSFQGEMANILQFSENFAGHKDLYPVKTYPELSNDNILCIEYLDGVKITDRETLLEKGFDPASLARKGLNLYLVQIFEHGFFHADPHAGNLFVMPSGKIAFIDFGSMGRLMAADQQKLEHFIVCFISRDVRRLIATIKKMAVRINIPDERKLERDIEEMFELLNSNSLQHIDTKEVLNRFSGTLNENEILMPEHIYLLVRGIVLLEGIGRKLDPQMNIVDSLRPYVQKIMRQRFSPEQLLSRGWDTLRKLGVDMTELPDNMNQIINKLNDGELKIIQEIKGQRELMDVLGRNASKLGYAVMVAGLAIASALLIVADRHTGVGNTGVLGLWGLLLCALLGLLFVLSSWRSRKK